MIVREVGSKTLEIPQVLYNHGNYAIIIPMEITEQQRKAIELLNPWYQGNSLDLGINRAFYLDQVSSHLESRKEILFLLGSRRVGKTIILFQYIYRLIQEGVPPKDIVFLSLDNTNLQELDLFSYLSESNFSYILLDEVHYLSNWAQALKSLYDLPLFKSKIICSGSSSKLIEDDKAFLTGRSSTMNVYPLSFNEFKKFNLGVQNQLNDYLYYGGYPEYVLVKNPNYLNELLRDIVEKDILKSHNVQDKKYLFDICQILAKQIGFKGSASKIAKVLGIDHKTATNYIDYLQEVRLIDEVYQYSPSLNEQLYAPKKYYFDDLGMRNSFVGFSDIGALVENAIFLKLSTLFGAENIYYLADDKLNEVDFVIKQKNDSILLIESKYNDLKESIINSLNPHFFKDVYGKIVTSRLVITNGVKATEIIKGCKIEFIPLSEFLEN